VAGDESEAKEGSMYRDDIRWWDIVERLTCVLLLFRSLREEVCIEVFERVTLVGR